MSAAFLYESLGALKPSKQTQPAADAGFLCTKLRVLQQPVTQNVHIITVLH